MKRKIPAICLFIFMSHFAPEAGAQGLVGVGQNMGDFEDFNSGLPLTWTLSAGGGWDSNSNTAPDAFENESAYVRAGIGAVYGAGNKTTQVNVGASLDTYYYFDNAPGLDDIFYNARGTLDVVHRATPRLTLIDNALVSYEIEPDYLVGASTSRRSDQYLYFYNRLAAAYAWGRKLSTVTAYTINGIFYESGPASLTEDRFTHGVSNQFRYALSRQTSLTAEYRYEFTNYDNISRDITSHYVLGGIDHYFTRTTFGTLAVGAQFYDDDLTGRETAPYAEAALNWNLTEDTSIRWANRLGFETNELTGFENRYTYRTGLSAQHRITPYLTASGGVSYAHSELDGLGPIPDADEDSIGFDAGLNFEIFTNTDLNLRYFFTDYSSDIPIRDYDRHRVDVGISTTF